MTRLWMLEPHKLHRLRSPLRPRPNRRAHRPFVHESLEDRTLLASATLDISNSGLTKGLLSYNPSANVVSALSVKTSTVITDPVDQFSELVYTITDTSEPITLGPGAIADGWTGSGTNSVTGPGSIKTTTTTSYVSSVNLNMLAGNASVTIASVGAAVNLSFNNHAGDVDSVLIGGPGGAQNISGNITITNASGSTALTVNDSGDTKAETVFVSHGEIANLEPSLISFGAANLRTLTLIGSNALGTLNVNANDQGPVAVTGGSATGSGTISIGSNPPINYSNFLAVNVSNAADQPVTQVSQTISTSTGDVPTEGKAFTYITAAFADADLQAKTSSFVATINWGDGSAPVAGSITANGAGQFEVSASHTFQVAGSYPVVTSITDLGTTDALSVAGIAVTISDLGGGGLTTGSTAQVNLVSNTASIPAPTTDPNLVNPWGIAGDANGRAWVADEGSGVATYEGPGGSRPEGTSVVIPPATGRGNGSPAGIVYNNTTAFSIGGQPSLFLYATLDGTISGWNGQFPSSGSPKAVIAVNNSAKGAIYTGLAIAGTGSQALLYVTNFQSGSVEVYNSQFALVSEFTDPNRPNGYVPSSIANIGGDLYVTFVDQASTNATALAGAGLGFVDIFMPTGTLVQRLITGSPLGAPSGVAMAPSDFGQFSNDLLVANQGDGHVNAFNPTTGQFVGAVTDATGAPLSNVGLHDLFFGAGDSLYFTAGLNGGADGLFGSLSPTPDSVAIEPATLAASISNITAFVNQPWQGVVATFTDANIYADPTDFTATVKWGDGTSDSSGDGNVTIIHADGIGSSFIVTGTHTYGTSTTGNQPDILSVTITEVQSGNSVYAQGTASVSDPTIHASFSGFSAFVGETYAGPVATFTDDAPDTDLADYSATINWGDGTTTSGNIIMANQAGQGYIVTDAGSHIYASATTGQVPYVVTVTITKHASNSAGAPVTESGEAIGNVAVSLSTLHATFSAFAPVAGTPYGGQIATFTEDHPVPGLEDNPDGDPNDYYTATINWGDGTSSLGTIIETNSAATAFAVTGSHTYKFPTTGASPAIVSVTIVKNDGSEAALVVGNVAVADALLFPFAQNVSFTATEGALFAGDGEVAEFTDADPFVTAANFNGPFASQTVISWGDGKSSVGVIVADPVLPGVFDVVGSHIYASPTAAGVPNTISVAVLDQWGGKTTITNNVVVAPAPLTFFDLALPVNPLVPIVARTPFTSDVTRFTSTNLAATANEYTATIDWGDGTPPDVGTVKEDGDAVFHVSGTHTYGAAGVFIIDIDTLVTGGVTFIDPTTAIVISDAPMDLNVKQLVSPNSITAAQPFTSPVAEFETLDPLATARDFSATIDWGDESAADPAPDTTAGTIVEGANDPSTGDPIFFVIGSHTYDQANSYTFSVSVSSAENPIILSSNIAVANAPTLITQPAPISGIAGQPLPSNTVVATFTDPEFINNPTAFASGTTAIVNWGDGTALDKVTATYDGTSPVGVVFDFIDSHIYSDPGISRGYQVTVTINTPDGSAAVVDDPAWMVSPPVPTPTPTPPPAPIQITNLKVLPITISPTAGQPLTVVVASFTALNVSLTSSCCCCSLFGNAINWGDGGPATPGVVQQGPNDANGNPTYFITGTHSYSATGTYSISATVSAPGGSSMTTPSSSSVNVFGAPLIAQSAPISGTQGQALPGDTVVATFSDPAAATNPAAFAQATHVSVNWGDGTAADSDAVVTPLQGQSTNSGAVFQITDTHTYQSITDVFQAFQVAVSIVTPDGGAAVVTDLALMEVPVLTDQPLAVQAVAGSALSVPLATIHAANAQTSAADFSASIQWGDGQSSTGTLEPEGQGSIAVMGSHTYTKSGSFPIAITLADKQGNTITDTQTAAVSNPLIVQALPVSARLREMFDGPVARFTDTAAGAGAGSFTVLINWGDGTTSDGTVVAGDTSSSGPTFVVNGSHKYTVKGTFSVVITVDDNGGNQASARTTVSVGATSRAAPRSVRPVVHVAKRIPSTHPSTSRQKPGAKATTALAHPHGPLRALKHS